MKPEELETNMRWLQEAAENRPQPQELEKEGELSERAKTLADNFLGLLQMPRDDWREHGIELYEYFDKETESFRKEVRVELAAPELGELDVPEGMELFKKVSLIVSDPYQPPTPESPEVNVITEVRMRATEAMAGSHPDQTVAQFIERPGPNSRIMDFEGLPNVTDDAKTALAIREADLLLSARQDSFIAVIDELEQYLENINDGLNQTIGNL